MKRILVTAFLASCFFYCNGQTEENTDYKRTAMTIGFLQGGGSLIGMDVEYLLIDHIGISVGFGLVGWRSLALSS